MAEIIVGVDESEGAAHALRWAVREGEVRGWSVEAVIAWGLLDQHHAGGGDRIEGDYGEPDALAAMDVAVVAAVGAERAETVGRRAVCDLAARALLEASRDAELLVLGARGLGGFRGLLLGSVSQQCVQESDVPVAIVRETVEREGDERIVVGVDGSATARRALRWAVEEAQARKASLDVVHAWHGVYAPGLVYPAFDTADFGRAAEELVAGVVADATAGAAGAGVTVRGKAVCGGAATVLLEEANGADLIVVGSRGLGPFKRLLLGSVANQVAQHASCPVVVVPHA